MTNLDARPEEEVCALLAARGPVATLHAARDVPLGGVRAMQVRRTLPQRDLPLVGAWCFLDEMGPQDVDMRVLPHPHTALQTVTWPLVGDILHRDSVGSEVVVRPGQLNLMTAGHGVSHSEFTLGDAAPLHGVQLWVALPDAVADAAPAFQQVSEPPRWEAPGGRATVFVGAMDGATSPAVVHTPLLGADVTVDRGRDVVLPLERGFEHAVLVLRGAATVAGVRVEPGPLLYLGDGRDELHVHADDDARLLLLGGVPFEHDLVMWWNFVGRTHAEIAHARAAWESPDAAERFGVVAGHGTARIPAPALPNVRLQPRRRTRPRPEAP
ncbi:pirin family protein [Cellulomonas fimi]|uniref:Pirin domain protein n=1 Tax=Cellulomonas fimi (strain ATCC 484 / DSM 20113 / JCM 1341 / CCUG 24087 / LMG 16345 / NBRC 15513 / NCIMB 8980 / NCTC 7547 / NRS-133) TaxID=590998 RepID=F4GZJ3_CELFA|nr:pirin family protein [Cellulomonas fimi]AEE46037.1 Pirin domain protein [Cellulomonas fimi ATCC 484]NNH06889.1 pirin family protein [Cellulomonas fimi]VEH31383.1 Quercetin 2,3-dioxygenase [Cellulomonas fimi]